MGNRALVQTVTLVFGVIYFAVGVLGFIGPLIGTNSFITITQDRHTLLGIADINLLHNLVHLLIGIAGLAAASSVANSRTFCQSVGVILVPRLGGWASVEFYLNLEPLAAIHRVLASALPGFRHSDKPVLEYPI